VATKERSKDGPKKKAGPRLEERPFSSLPLEKPPMPAAQAAVWDDVVASMPSEYFTAGDKHVLMGYCHAVASWFDVLGSFAAVHDGEREEPLSKLERALRAEIASTAKMLGIVPPLERRMKQERPRGALTLLDAHRPKVS